MRAGTRRRLEKLEALLNARVGEPSSKISEQALELLPTSDVRLIVYGLRRIREVLKRAPVEGVDYPSVLEKHLTHDELDAYRRWKNVEAVVRGGR